MAYLDNIRVFIRVYELGGLSSAGRDQRLSPAVVSNRIKELEKHLGARLFNRTTRRLTPTEQGRLFYNGAQKILEAVMEAESAVTDITKGKRGSVHIAAPLGLGKRVIAPLVPQFNDLYPKIEVRLRLTDRKLDLTAEGVDASFQLGALEDSNLRMRPVVDCERALCASPEYLQANGAPRDLDDLVERHSCLLLRFPGATEFVWDLQTPDGVRRAAVSGPFDSDDGDVLTDWALAGRGIVNKPMFEVADLLEEGRLVRVLEETPPVPSQLVCLYPHKQLLDPKVRLFIDFMIGNCRRVVSKALVKASPSEALRRARRVDA